MNRPVFAIAALVAGLAAAAGSGETLAACSGGMGVLPAAGQQQQAMPGMPMQQQAAPSTPMPGATAPAGCACCRNMAMMQPQPGTPGGTRPAPEGGG